MDQQHQNFFSSDFSFVNAFAGTESSSYSLNQQTSDHNSKGISELGLPTLINQEFDSRAIGNSSLYDLSNPQYSQMPYHQMQSSSINAVLHQKQKPIVVENAAIPTLEESGEKKIIHDQFPDQPCSSKSSDTVSFDPSQNSIMKALGVVRKDVLGASSNKKRKRIVVLNDDSDDDASNLKSEIFNKSNDNPDDAIIGSEEKNDASESDIQTDNDESENLTDIGALKAKFLLKNAVIIQGPDKKKKKSRLLDSDDENQMQATSVDDIGLMNEDENEDESFENDILISEPIVPTDSSAISVEGQEENETEKSNPPTALNLGDVPPEEPLKNDMPTVVNDPEVKLNEQLNLTERNDVPTKTTEECLKTQSADENEIDPSMSVEAILENIKPMADDDEFFKFDKSSDENDKIPNDEYFGTPDKQQQQGYENNVT